MITPANIDWYLDRGLDLVPLRGKAPFTNGWIAHKFTRDELLRHAASGGNIGYRIGEGHVVLDVDVRSNGLESLEKLKADPEMARVLSEATCVKTGGGGYHYYLMYDGPTLKNELAEYKGVEVKGHGKQVVIPGSVHPESNAQYEFYTNENAGEFPPLLPKWFVEKYKKEEWKGEAPGDYKTIPPDELKEILDDCDILQYTEDYEGWRRMLMASAHTTDGEGLDVFVDWCIQDPKYANDGEKIRAEWSRILRNPPENKLGIGTLLRAAGRETVERKSELECESLLDEAESPSEGKSVSVLAGPTMWDLATNISQYILNSRFEGGRHFCYGSDNNCWQYNGRFWEILKPKDLQGFIFEDSGKYCRDHHVKKAKMSSLLKDVACNLKIGSALDPASHDFTTSPKINCQNVTLHLDIKTGDVTEKPHNPLDMLPYMVEAEYHRSSKCPKFDRALDEIFCGDQELIDHVLEIFGYAIQPSKNIAKWFLFYGEGGSNGKTTLISILDALLGKAALHKGMNEFEKDKHAMASLVGKLAVIDDDLPEGMMLPDAFLKKFTEDKQVSARPLFSASFDFKCSATVIMSSNNLPMTRDVSGGMRRRACVVPFKREFLPGQRDNDLADYIIANELGGVLRRSLEGLKRLRSRGDFNSPMACEKATDQWRVESNQINTFFDEIYDHDDSETITFNEIWQSYLSWVELQSISKSYTQYKFKRAMQKVGMKLENKDGRLYVPAIKRKVIN